MNIFVLDRDVDKCAQYHNNRHLVKMILEQVQLLCSVHWMSGGEAPYRLTHKNHPCAIWTRTSLSNYNWLCELTFALGREYTCRYGKKHKSISALEKLLENTPNIPDIGMTPFALAMPDNVKCGDAIQSYRNYYMKEKRHLAEWKNRDVPYWYQ